MQSTASQPEIVMPADSRFKTFAFIDTETNGTPSPKYDCHHRSQCHTAQVALLLTDASGREIDRYVSIVTPDHYDMPDFLVSLHGISVARARSEGRSRHEVFVENVMPRLERADIIIAHNYAFDSRVLELEEERGYGFTLPPRSCLCTMKELTAVCGLRNSRGAPKWPKLMEAYQFVFGKQFDGAHDALADMLAMRDLFFESLRRGYFKL